MNKKEDIIQKLKKKFNEKFLELDNLIQKTFPSQINILDDVLIHIQKFNGKRLRTILLFLFYDFFSNLYSKNNLGEGENNKNLFDIALAIEFIHNATLFHDDVIDNNKEFRRGIRPANQIWHNKLCILSGDFLLAKAFEKIIQVNILEISQILSETSSIIIKGEVNQLILSEFRLIEKYTIEDYLKVIFEKTAILFSSSAKIGLILGSIGFSEKIQNFSEIMNACENFGKYLGIAFQIMDDILDYFGDQEILGKKIGVDFFEGKLTLPVILFFEELPSSEKNKWLKILTSINCDFDEIQFEEMFKNFLHELKSHNIYEKSLKFVDAFIEKAKCQLKILKDNEFCKDFQNIDEFLQNLSEILDFLLIRKV